jgi:hypothetical protein
VTRAAEAVLSVMLGCVLGFVLSSSTRSASASDGCPGGDYHEQASPTTNGRGVRTSGNGMRVSNTWVGCERVSSIGVEASGGDFVEVGWYEIGPELSGLAYCAGTDGRPRTFVYVRVFGVDDCFEFGYINTEGLGQNLRAQDLERDETWEFYRNAQFLISLSTNMSSGPGIAQGERQNLHNSIYSEFQGLQRMNTNQQWVNWTGTSTGGSTINNDPEYGVCIPSSTHVTVDLGCP